MIGSIVNSMRMFKIFVFCCFISLVYCGDVENVDDVQRSDETLGRMIEEGRTMVHHAVKRFMIILPAIFFKLGIAFTLLILVTIVAVNNGFIGFMLLVVGLSSVLARLQESRQHPVVLPYISPLPPYHHQHFLDRADNNGGVTGSVKQFLPYNRYTTYTTPNLKL